MAIHWAKRTRNICSLLIYTFSILIFFLPFQKIQASPVSVRQTFSLSLGFFKGDGDLFSQYERLPVPDLNPQLQLTTNLNATMALPGDLELDVQAGRNGDFKGFLCLRYKDWQLDVGPQILSFREAPLSFNRNIEGVRLRHDNKDGLDWDFFLSQNKTIYMEISIDGEDSLGPYFLGHANIIEKSETVFVNDIKQDRGSGPNDNDYYIDYQSGFMYFNKIVFTYQKIKVTYEYVVAERELASTFLGTSASYKVTDKLQLRAFAFRDKLPLARESIKKEAGFTNWGWGLAGDLKPLEGLTIKHTLLGSDFNKFEALTQSATDQWTLDPEVFEYTLSETPVLYESETVCLDDEELTRYLDYSIDYISGEINLAHAEGNILSVEYQYITTGVSEEENQRGVYSVNQVDYLTPTVKSNSLLNFVVGDYRSFQSKNRPTEDFLLSTKNEMAFTDNWSGRLNFAVLKRLDVMNFLPTLSLHFRRGIWQTALELASDIKKDPGGTVGTDLLKGHLALDTPTKVRLEFSKDLAIEAPLPEKIALTVSGNLAKLPYSLEYLHGDKVYSEKINGRIFLPINNDNFRGNISLNNNLLFKENFSQPHIAGSIIGQLNYSNPRYFYLHTKGNLTLNRSQTGSSRIYNFTGEIGRDIGAAVMANYQLKLEGLNTYLGGELAAYKNNINHTATLTGYFLENFDGTVAYSRLSGENQRPGRPPAETKSHLLNLSLGYKYRELSLRFGYNYSDVYTTVEDQRVTKKSHQIKGDLDWANEDFLSVRGGIGWTFQDKKNSRISASLRPYKAISDVLELWSEYNLLWSKDSSIQEEALYKTHIFKFGFSYRL